MEKQEEKPADKLKEMKTYKDIVKEAKKQLRVLYRARRDEFFTESQKKIF